MAGARMPASPGAGAARGRATRGAMRPSTELVEIGKAGGSIVVPPDKTYTAEELIRIADGVKQGGGKLIIQDAGRYDSDELVAVCQAAPTQVYVYE